MGGIGPGVAPPGGRPASPWARTVRGHLTTGVPFLVDGAPSNATSIFNLVELLTSFAYTARRIMEWAVWADYFIEHEARR